MKRKSIMVDEEIHTELKIKSAKEKKSIEGIIKEILSKELGVDENE